jgi:hypothetical protein
MIEPQNTMLPIAAAPRTPRQPLGESGEFGEVLAQSLSFVAQVDPNAVQQIAAGPHHQGETPDGDVLGEDGDSPLIESVVPAAATSRDAGNAVPGFVEAASPIAPATPIRVMGGIVDPDSPTDVSAVPDASTEPGSRQAQSPPTSPTPLGTPATDAPVDGTREPVLSDPPLTVESTPDPGIDAVPVPMVAEPTDAVGVPVRTENPDGGTTATAAVAPLVTNPAPRAAGESVQRTRLPSGPAVPIGPDDPVRPIQRDDGTTAPVEAVDVSTQVAGSEPADSPAPVVANGQTAQSQVVLRPESTVHLDTSQPVAPAMGNDTGPGVAVDSGIGETPVSFGSPTSTSTPVGSPAANAAPGLSSALAERVMRAVDLQRTQPPPRSMVVDIPELEGLRLVVSVRAGGHVTVTPASSGAGADAFAPFAEDLSRILTERGFVMNGDDRRGRHNPQNEEEPAPFRTRRPTFRRQARDDGELRI